MDTGEENPARLPVLSTTPLAPPAITVLAPPSRVMVVDHADDWAAANADAELSWRMRWLVRSDRYTSVPSVASPDGALNHASTPVPSRKPADWVPAITVVVPSDFAICWICC